MMGKEKEKKLARANNARQIKKMVQFRCSEENGLNAARDMAGWGNMH